MKLLLILFILAISIDALIIGSDSGDSCDCEDSGGDIREIVLIGQRGGGGRYGGRRHHRGHRHYGGGRGGGRGLVIGATRD